MRSIPTVCLALMTVACAALFPPTAAAAPTGVIEPLAVACEGDSAYQFVELVDVGGRGRSGDPLYTSVSPAGGQPGHGQTYLFVLPDDAPVLVRVPVPQGEAYSVWDTLGMVENSFEAIRCGTNGEGREELFTDVPAGTTFFDDITWLADMGVATGWDVGDGWEFRPSAPIARNAMAAFLYRLAGEPEFVPPARPYFRDVPTTSPFYKEISWLAAEGISSGWADGNTRYFRPSTMVGRDAMAAFLYRVAGRPDYTPPTRSPFRDVATTNPFYTEISWLANAGISTGWTTGSAREFRPLEPVRRNAMAAFLQRLTAAETPTLNAPGTLFVAVTRISFVPESLPLWDGTQPLTIPNVTSMEYRRVAPSMVGRRITFTPPADATSSCVSRFVTIDANGLAVGGGFSGYGTVPLQYTTTIAEGSWLLGTIAYGGCDWTLDVAP